MTLLCSAGAVYLSPFADIKTLLAVVTRMWSSICFMDPDHSNYFNFMGWFICFVPAVILSPYTYGMENIYGMETLFAVVMGAQVIRVLFILLHGKPKCIIGFDHQTTNLHFVFWSFAVMVLYSSFEQRRKTAELLSPEALDLHVIIYL